MNEHRISEPSQMGVLENPLRKIVWMLFGGVTFRLASGLATIVIASFLNASAYGEMMNAVFWALLVGMIAGAGLSDLIVKNRFDPLAEDTATQVLHAWVLACAIGATMIALFYVILIRGNFSPQGATFFLLCCASSIFTALNLIAQGALRAAGHMIALARILTVTAVAINAGLVFLAWYTRDIVILGEWYLLSFFGAFLLHFVVLRFFGLTGLRRVKTGILLNTFMQSLPFGIVQLLMLLLPILSATFVLRLLGSEAAGSYNLIIALYLAAANISTVLDHVFYPMLVASAPDLSKRATSYFVISLFISLPAIALFGYYGPNLAHAIFDEKYLFISELIVLLGVLVPLRFANRCLTVFLRLKGKQRVSVVAYGLATVGLFSLTMFVWYWDQETPSVMTIASFLLIAEVSAFCILLVNSYTFFDANQIAVEGRGLLRMVLISASVIIALDRIGLPHWSVLTIGAVIYCGIAYISGFLRIAS